MTEGNLRTIHVFPSQDSYETNQGSIGADDLALIPVDIFPTGAIIPFAGNNIPSGYLPCNGGAISRETYADLFAVIGTTYGSGNGSTTFNLPNLTDKFIQGSNTAGTVKSAGLPNITGEFNGQGFNEIDYSSSYTVTGAFSLTSGTNWVGRGGGKASRGLVFNASGSNTIYGNSTTVQPPALTMLYIIKY